MNSTLSRKDRKLGGPWAEDWIHTLPRDQELNNLFNSFAELK